MDAVGTFPSSQMTPKFRSLNTDVQKDRSYINFCRVTHERNETEQEVIPKSFINPYISRRATIKLKENHSNPPTDHRLYSL